MKTILLIFISLLGVAQVGYSATAAKPSTAKKVATTKQAPAVPPYYGPGLCNTPGYTCLKTKAGDTWQKLFPNATQRHIVQEVNRTNLNFRVGTTFAVPNDLSNIILLDVAPFPKKIKPMDNKLIMVDQNRLAWGAYDRNGDLVRWGAISSGKDYCPDIGKSCNTMTGEFYVFNKEDKKCESSVFPIGEGGAIMPYCMFFYRGYALHGSLEVPGFRDSHGCVRMFVEDALWLNTKFVELPSAKNNNLGTKVVIQQLTSVKQEK